MLFAIPLLVSCATVAKYQENVESWMGSREEALVSSWGAPNSTFAFADGSRVLTYIYDGGGVAHSYGYVTTIHRATCKTDFTVSAEGVVTQWRFEGTACRSR